MRGGARCIAARRILRFVAAASFALLAGAGACHAQDYPSRPIRLVVPFPPGGPNDFVARAIGQKLSESLGQPVVVDFRGGAAGNIGTDTVAKAAPDGYTLLITSSGFAIAPATTKLPFDPIRDFAPISQTTAGHDVLIVNPALPVKSVKELIALAKQKPGKLMFASAGTGGTLHLHGELFKMMTGIDMLHVPYKGAGPAVIDVVGGHVDLMFVGMAAALPNIRNGKLRALGVSSQHRVASLPDVPTIVESGVPGFVASPFSGMLAPAATPKPIVAKVNAAVVQALQSQDIRERFATMEVEPKSSTPAEFGAYLREQIAKWGRVAKAAGLKPE